MKRPKEVSQSSFEVEYTFISNAALEAVWIMFNSALAELENYMSWMSELTTWDALHYSKIK